MRQGIEIINKNLANEWCRKIKITTQNCVFVTCSTDQWSYDITRIFEEESWCIERFCQWTWRITSKKLLLDRRHSKQVN
mgnify:CR=1 FL=1